jgi:predicted nucleic acid-binding protein
VGVTRYLADKSALARLHLPAVREELEPLMTRALVGICGVTELEMLYSARNIQERARMKEQLEASLDRIDIPGDIWEQAAGIQDALTEQAQHRSASIPDLIVAATARARGLEILHYDRDFETLDCPTRHGVVRSHPSRDWAGAVLKALAHCHARV